MIGSVATGGTLVGASFFVTAVCLGTFFGGLSGMLVGCGLTYPAPLMISVGGLTYAACTKREHRKTTPRSQRATVHAPEEVVTDQPKAESPSPEPESAKGGWLNLGSWFVKPSEDTEFVDESSV